MCNLTYLCNPMEYEFWQKFKVYTNVTAVITWGGWIVDDRFYIINKRFCQRPFYCPRRQFIRHSMPGWPGAGLTTFISQWYPARMRIAPFLLFSNHIHNSVTVVPGLHGRCIIWVSVPRVLEIVSITDIKTRHNAYLHERRGIISSSYHKTTTCRSEITQCWENCHISLAVVWIIDPTPACMERYATLHKNLLF